MAPKPRGGVKGRGKKTLQIKDWDESKFTSKNAEERYEILSSDSAKILDCYSIDPTTLDDLGLNDVWQLLGNASCQSLLSNRNPYYRNEVVEFYSNLYLHPDGITLGTMVHGLETNFTPDTINEILGIELASVGPNFYFARGEGWPKPEEVPINVGDMGEKYFGASKVKYISPASTLDLKYLSSYDDRMLYQIVHKSLLPTGGNATEPNTGTALFFYFLKEGVRFNPGYAISRHMLTCVAKKRANNNMPYGSLVTQLLRRLHPDEPFTSPPVEVKFYDEDFLKNHGWGVVDGKLAKRPPRTKAKKAKVTEGENEADLLYSMYKDMKGAMRDLAALNKETYMLQKTFRAIKRAELSSNFEILTHEDGGHVNDNEGRGSGQCHNPDNQDGANGNDGL